jgi:hypothetical protein
MPFLTGITTLTSPLAIAVRTLLPGGNRHRRAACGANAWKPEGVMARTADPARIGDARKFIYR